MHKVKYEKVETVLAQSTTTNPTKSYAIRSCFSVYPESDPGQCDDECAGEVEIDRIIAPIAFHHEVSDEYGIISCISVIKLPMP